MDDILMPGSGRGESDLQAEEMEATASENFSRTPKHKDSTAWCFGGCSSALIVTVGACVVMFQLHVVQLAPTGCEGNPCGAHGVCVPDKEQHSCACKDGWTGDSCSVQTGCDAGVNCGQGRCVPHNGQHTCECDVGWCGPTCNIKGIGEHAACAFTVSGTVHKEYQGSYAWTDRVCNGAAVYQQTGGGELVLFRVPATLGGALADSNAQWAIGPPIDAVTCSDNSPLLTNIYVPPSGLSIGFPPTPGIASPDIFSLRSTWFEQGSDCGPEAFNKQFCASPDVTIDASWGRGCSNETKHRPICGAHGVCIPQGDHEYKCGCDKDYHGPKCDVHCPFGQCPAYAVSACVWSNGSSCVTHVSDGTLQLQHL